MARRAPGSRGPARTFSHRRSPASAPSTQTTGPWLSILEPADVWCADVYTWDKLMSTEAFADLGITQRVSRPNGTTLETTCCPIIIDGKRPRGGPAAPTVGQDNDKYVA